MGEWVGPTLLFAAKRARKAVGAEPDPFAYDILRKNLLSNPSLAAKTTLSRLCISAKGESLTMYGIGGSGSFLETVSNVLDHKNFEQEHPTQSWVAHCVPLYAFLEDKDAITDDMFIKLDTEGAEQIIIPSLYSFLANFTRVWGFPYKPAFFISFHDANKFPAESMAAVKAMINLYKYYSVVDFQMIAKEEIMFESGSDFDTEIFKEVPWADIYLTDREPSEYDL